jgi:hypothetical protein
MVEPAKKPVVISVGSETTPLRLEEDEEYEEVEVTKVEASTIEPSKHVEKPVHAEEGELEEKESKEPLKLEEEQPEEVVEEPEEEKQVQQEPKGRAGSRL